MNEHTTFITAIMKIQSFTDWWSQINK
jgi:hypothetical protein